MKKIVLIGLIVAAFLIVAGYNQIPKISGVGFSGMFSGGQKKIGVEEAKKVASDFIEKNLLQAGTKFTIENVSEENGMYKMALDVSGQKIEAYLSFDGKMFFPQGMNIEETSKEKSAAAEKEATEAPKSEKPAVELFVMSYCPYGTQMEKGILPVLEKLGNKIDFKLRFVSYAMHDKKELDENLRDYCIQKNEPQKLEKYLACFLKKGQGTEDACMAEAGVNATQVSSCAASVDQEFKVSELYADKSTWQGGRFPQFNVEKDLNEKYGVEGSPTLVVNGSKTSSGRDSASILKTICSAFESAPEECQAELSSTSPAPGFGEGTTASETDASCGS
jgi:hypothetical protein